MAVGPTRFLTENGKPLHPVVKSTERADGVVDVEALLHQTHFTKHNIPVPPLTDATRYTQMPIKKADFDTLPEGKYDIDEAGNVDNITAASVQTQSASHITIQFLLSLNSLAAVARDWGRRNKAATE